MKTSSRRNRRRSRVRMPHGSSAETLRGRRDRSYSPRCNHSLFKMAPATAASRRPVVDLDETGFSLAPVNLCRSGYHLKPKLPDMLIAVDFREDHH